MQSLQGAGGRLCGRDLLNQIITSGFTALKVGALTWESSACSSFCEGLFAAGLLVTVLPPKMLLPPPPAITAPRSASIVIPPVRRPVATYPQHTVTGAAARSWQYQGSGPRLELATVGKVMDLGIRTLQYGLGHLAGSWIPSSPIWKIPGKPSDYDLIVTGDLGKVGREILVELGQREGLDLSSNYRDCGELIYSKEQMENAGASGCACVAIVTLGLLFNQNYQRVLVVATGALHSPTSYQQGDSIPTIAHAVSIEFS